MIVQASKHVSEPSLRIDVVSLATSKVQIAAVRVRPSPRFPQRWRAPDAGRCRNCL